LAPFFSRLKSGSAALAKSPSGKIGRKARLTTFDVVHDFLQSFGFVTTVLHGALKRQDPHLFRALRP
jgi:hypothetical protein